MLHVRYMIYFAGGWDFYSQQVVEPHLPEQISSNSPSWNRSRAPTSNPPSRSRSNSSNSSTTSQSSHAPNRSFNGSPSWASGSEVATLSDMGMFNEQDDMVESPKGSLPKGHGFRVLLPVASGSITKDGDEESTVEEHRCYIRLRRHYCFNFGRHYLSNF